MKWWWIPVAAMVFIVAFTLGTVTFSLIIPLDFNPLCLPGENNCNAFE